MKKNNNGDLNKMILSLTVAGTFFILGSANHAFAQTTSVPQIVNNPNPVVIADNYDLWFSNALNRFESQQIDAKFTENSGSHAYDSSANKEAVLKWQKIYVNLLAGIQNAGAQTPELTLVYQIAERTLELSNALTGVAAEEADATLENYSIGIDRAYLPMIYVFHRGAEAIKNITSLDRVYYKALKNLRSKKPNLLTSDVKFLETELKNYAVEQLSWFKQNFDGKGDNGIPVKFSPKVYYVVLNSMLKQLSSILAGNSTINNPSLFPASFANSISKMGILTETLDSYLAGNPVFGGNPVFTYYGVKKLLSEIESSLRDCR